MGNDDAGSHRIRTIYYIWIIHFSQCWFRVGLAMVVNFFLLLLWELQACARSAGYYLLSESVIFKGIKRKMEKENLWCDE